MDKKLIDEINDKTDIVQLISSYVKLERKGKNYFGLCPFHDDTDPSMSVSPDKNIFKCFSCGVGGSPITFYQQINHTTFNEALAALAEPLGIKVAFAKKAVSDTLIEHQILEEVSKFYRYYLNNSESGKEALDYLKSRKLNMETIDHFQIGLSPEKDSLYKLLKQKNFTEEQMINSHIITLKNNEYKDFFNSRVMFPIRDIKGDVVGFSGRAIDDKTPKYYNSPESKIFKKGEVLYHLYEALGDIRKLGYAIIHEGFFDCIASFEAGIKNTIATMGTALTIEHAKILENYTNHVIIAFDGDNAGVNAAIKAINILKETKLRIDVLRFPKGLDPDDYIKNHGKENYIKLYESSLLDQYEFIYTASKENLDLKNTNDMSILKDVVKNMLVKAPQGVKELYIKRLSEDLNVTVSGISKEILRKTREIRVKDEPKKASKKSLPNKFYKAERELLISMFRNIEDARRIEQALTSEYVCDINIFKLRTILVFKYYANFEEFDEDNFKEVVKEEIDSEELLKTLDEVIKSLEYNLNFVYTPEDIDEKISVMETVVDERKKQELLLKIKAETESYQKTILIEEFREEKLKSIK